MKKKNKSMYLVLTLLLLLVAGFTTYAIYKTSKSGTANVSAANWIVKVTANNTTTNVTGGANNINLGTCPNLLAPGGSCTIPFTVDMTESEVDSILTVGIGSGINQDTLSLMNEAGLSLKISDGTNIQNAYTLNYGTTKTLNLVIDWEAGSEDDDNKASADVALSKTVGTLSIPVNMIVRQYNGINRTVTFNTHDENITTPEAITVSDGGYVTNIPVLDNKENLIFRGWYTSQVGGTKLTSTTPIIENTEYHARFSNPQNITITFDSNGGSSVTSQTILEGSTLSTLPTSTKNGFNLVGWFDENDNQLSTSTIINGAKTYTAHWQEIPTYSVGQAVYFDPTSPNTICSSTSPSSNASTCMKWRVIETNDNNTKDTITLQLDHNLVNTVAWNTSGSNDEGPVTVLTSLAGKTTNWTNVDPLTYTYDTSASAQNYGILSCTSGTCTVKNSTINNVKARLITAEEIAAITRTQTSGETIADNFTLANQNWFYFSNSDYQIGTQSSGTGNTNLKWLIENTRVDSSYPSGSTSGVANSYSDNYGYWTLSPTSTASFAYGVSDRGGLIYSYVDSSSTYGARPVITISKSKLK